MAPAFTTDIKAEKIHGFSTFRRSVATFERSGFYEKQRADQRITGNNGFGLVQSGQGRWVITMTAAAIMFFELEGRRLAHLSHCPVMGPVHWMLEEVKRKSGPIVALTCGWHGLMLGNNLPDPEKRFGGLQR